MNNINLKYIENTAYITYKLCNIVDLKSNNKRIKLNIREKELYKKYPVPENAAKYEKTIQQSIKKLEEYKYSICHDGLFLIII